MMAACAESIGQAYLSAYRGTYILPSSMQHVLHEKLSQFTVGRSLGDTKTLEKVR